MRRCLLPLVFVISVFFGACSSGNEDHLYSGFRNIPSGGWVYGDTLDFVFPCDSVNPDGYLAFAVRHTGAYKYANLWVEVTLKNDDTTVLDTLNIRLADKYGRRLGRGVGVSYVKVDTILGNISFEKPFTAGVRHIMRVDTLRDIEQLGLIRIQ